MTAKYLHLVRIALVLFIALTACNSASKPTVVILSPASGSEFQDGETVAIQSTATDSAAIVRVELIVDNIVVRTDAAPTPQGQPSLTLIQTWKATQGNHTIVVRAYNASGGMSDPVAVAVSVQSSVSSLVPTIAPTVPLSVRPTVPPPTAPPPPTTASSSSASSASSSCANDAAFVADVTVPDGTNFAVNQTFNKIWRLSNSGSCTWGVGYQLVFVSGTAMTGSTIVNVPATAPGGTADVLVPMTAPANNGSYTGVWRMRVGGSAFFGKNVTVKINVVGGATSSSASSSVTSSSPSGCTGQPNIASFTASAASVPAATTITVVVGTPVTLSWGEVTNADSLEIDNGIGGQPSPGSITITPGATTTYTLTAHCGANIKTAQVKVNVGTLAPPIASFTLNALTGNESGTLYDPADSIIPTGMLVGDTGSNKLARAFIGFDISALHGRTIDSAKLDLTGCTQTGNPFSTAVSTQLGGIWVGEVQYSVPLSQAAYNASGTAIIRLTSKPVSTIDVKSLVQTRVTQNRDRFQIRLHLYAQSDMDGNADYMLCSSGVPKLTIIAE
ncbi:MAG: hypothetical protein HZB51_12615 [Chloroflexi bacterium]|nr:hypothetical protein [Chloroflexota bacterium]